MKSDLVCSLIHITRSISNPICPIVKYIFNPSNDNLCVQQNNHFHGIQCIVEKISYDNKS